LYLKGVIICVISGKHLTVEQDQYDLGVSNSAC